MFIYKITYIYLEGSEIKMEVAAASQNDALKAAANNTLFAYDVHGMPIKSIEVELLRKVKDHKEQIKRPCFCDYSYHADGC